MEALSERRARDLLHLVTEFLQFLNYQDTVKALIDERGAKRALLNNSLLSARAQTKDARERLRSEMVRNL